MQRCFNCQKELQLRETPGRNDRCPHCSADLRCCFNCRFYSPTVSKQCMIPTVEPVKSKNSTNFCDEFKIREFHDQTPISQAEQAKKRLDDLFRKL